MHIWRDVLLLYLLLPRATSDTLLRAEHGCELLRDEQRVAVSIPLANLFFASEASWVPAQGSSGFGELDCRSLPDVEEYPVEAFERRCIHRRPSICEAGTKLLIRKKQRCYHAARIITSSVGIS